MNPAFTDTIRLALSGSLSRLNVMIEDGIHNAGVERGMDIREACPSPESHVRALKSASIEDLEKALEAKRAGGLLKPVEKAKSAKKGWRGSVSDHP